ncbi:blue-light-activated protein [mine drainage metagenome]|uniref:Blue-light-activated protein n=1 Tax=mine drainage metagenome TaxID=410659 RepID=A0A1J5SEF1_9ZZZZ
MKALNVDDRDENLYFLETVLRAAGFEVLNAHNGVEALALLDREKVDLIVSDVLMPQMDGFLLCREVRRRPDTADVPFVFYTGSYTDTRDAELAERIGATAYLIKPMEPAVLADTLRKAAEQGAARPLGAGLEDESSYFRSFSESIVRKLEEKAREYEMLSRRLQGAFDEKVKEVADRLHVEDTLRLSEERYRAVVSSLAEGILLADGAGQIVACNDSAARILGLPKSQLLVSTLSEPLWTTLRGDGTPMPAGEHPLGRCLRTGESSDGAVLGVQRPGAPTIWVSANVRPCLRDARNAVTLAVMSIADITAQRAALERIEQQAHMIDQANDAIVICAADGTLRYWNKGAERLYGWTEAEALGRRDLALFAQPQAQLGSPLARALDQKSLEGEFHHRTKDGREIIVSGRLTAVRSGEGSADAVLASYIDVTEKKQLEEKFLRAQRLESIGILAGGVAHDLNNILAPILLAVPIVRMRVSDPQGLMLLDTVEASANRGAQIVRQILTFSRGLRTERIVIQARHLLKEIAELIQETFPRNIEIETDLPRSLWTIEADTTQMHQVFMNLCVNARDAMSKGGTLTLAGENVTLDENSASRFVGGHPGRFVRLSVVDTGCGIPPDLMKRVFEPFFTTKDPGKGTGLGLSTARSIVEQHDGFMGVDSRVGQGTRFDIYLPAIVSAEEDTPVLSRDLPHGKGQLVIVVDDEFALRHISESLLTAHDYRVLTADSGQQGLALVRANLAEVALVITDLLMPGMSGVELIQLLRGQKPSLKIVAISGTVSPGGENKPPPGIIVDAFLNKPFSAEQLLLTVNEVLAD